MLGKPAPEKLRQVAEEIRRLCELNGTYIYLNSFGEVVLTDDENEVIL